MTRKHSFNEVNYHVTPQYGRCLLKLDTIHATDRPLDSSLVLNTEEAVDDVIRQREGIDIAVLQDGCPMSSFFVLDGL